MSSFQRQWKKSIHTDNPIKMIELLLIVLFDWSVSDHHRQSTINECTNQYSKILSMLLICCIIALTKLRQGDNNIIIIRTLFQRCYSRIVHVHQLLWNGWSSNMDQFSKWKIPSKFIQNFELAVYTQWKLRSIEMIRIFFKCAEPNPNHISFKSEYRCRYQWNKEHTYSIKCMQLDSA